MEINGLKDSISSLTEKAEADKELLRKASRAQKLRAERFEAAVEKCYEQLKQKVWCVPVFHSTTASTFFQCGSSVSLKMCFFCWLTGSWSSQGTGRERVEKKAKREGSSRVPCWVVKEVCFSSWSPLSLLSAETRVTQWTLKFHVLFFSQVADLASRLQKEKDEVAAAKTALLQQTEQLAAKNTDLSISNEALKVKLSEVWLILGNKKIYLNDLLWKCDFLLQFFDKTAIK